MRDSVLHSEEKKSKKKGAIYTSVIYAILIIILFMPGLQCGSPPGPPYPDSNVGMQLSFGDPQGDETIKELPKHNPEETEKPNEQQENELQEEVEDQQEDQPEETEDTPEELTGSENGNDDVTLPENNTPPVVKNEPKETATEDKKDPQENKNPNDAYNPEEGGDGTKDPKGNSRETQEIKDKYDQGQGDQGQGSGGGNGGSGGTGIDSKYFLWPEVAFNNCVADASITVKVKFYLDYEGKASKFDWGTNNNLTSTQKSCIEGRLRAKTFKLKNSNDIIDGEVVTATIVFKR